MSVLSLKSKYLFSVDDYLNQNLKFINKLVIKRNKNLALKYTPSIYLCTKLTKHGLTLKTYKNLQKQFLYTIVPYISQLPDNNELKNLLYLYNSFYNLNKIILWKFNAINPLFNTKIIAKQKVTYYLKKKNRAHTLSVWTKFLLKSKYLNKFHHDIMFKVLWIILLENVTASPLHIIKLKTYKQQFLKG